MHRTGATWACRSAVIAAVAALAFTSACNRSREGTAGETAARTQGADTAGAMIPVPTPGADTSAAVNTSGATTGGALTDANIVALLTTANEGEIKEGQLAASKATNPKVKSFAKQMVTDHTANNKQVQALSIQPAENADVAELKSESESESRDVGQKTGKAFDAAYIDAQVKDHEKVLDTINNKLLPNAQDPKLKTLLTATRQKVSQHLDKAKAIQSSLGA
jgi:putative membrane protein